MKTRKETDSLGSVEVPADRLWGAQTQRSLQFFSIGKDLMPEEMVYSYVILKKACAIVNHREGRLEEKKKDLIGKVCDEILEGKHKGEFPLHVWMTGSGTQFNMNINEVIANRCSQISGQPLGSKTPVHPNDDVNMAQSTNDTFPTAMYMTVAIGAHQKLLPALQLLQEALSAKAKAWKDIVKIGRTHLQDATPLTLGQEFSGYTVLMEDNIERVKQNLSGVYQLALGGTAVGTGINAAAGFDKEAAKEIAKLTGISFQTARNKFAVQGSHDALVQFSGILKTIAVSVYKIAGDLRLLSSGPRAGLNELQLPSNEPGSSIMPGKVNPTQCEALAMVAAQVMANDHAVALGGAGGDLQMNVYKPLMIYNLVHSMQLLTDSITNFTKYTIEGAEPNRQQIQTYVERSLMLVTALSPVIGYDKASEVAHYALKNDLTLKEAALELKYVSEKDYDQIVDPAKMVHPYFAKE